MTDENPGADVIEKDIVQTQNDISDTVNELQDKLHPKQLFQQFVGSPKDAPAQLFEALKRNPVAAAMVGVGALWLVSGKQAKLPGFKSKRAVGYEDHLASVSRYEGESEDVYQSRLETARLSYHPKAAGGVRQRIGDKLKNLAGGSGLNGLTSSVKDRSRSAREWSVSKHDEAPFVTAIAAAATGAIAALALPKTQIEREKLTPLRDTAVSKASALKDQAIEAAQNKLGASTQPAQAS